MMRYGCRRGEFFEGYEPRCRGRWFCADFILFFREQEGVGTEPSETERTPWLDRVAIHSGPCAGGIRHGGRTTKLVHVFRLAPEHRSRGFSEFVWVVGRRMAKRRRGVPRANPRRDRRRVACASVRVAMFSASEWALRSGAQVHEGQSSACVSRPASRTGWNPTKF